MRSCPLHHGRGTSTGPPGCADPWHHLALGCPCPWGTQSLCTGLTGRDVPLHQLHRPISTRAAWHPFVFWKAAFVFFRSAHPPLVLVRFPGITFNVVVQHTCTSSEMAYLNRTPGRAMACTSPHCLHAYQAAACVYAMQRGLGVHPNVRQHFDPLGSWFLKQVALMAFGQGCSACDCQFDLPSGFNQVVNSSRWTGQPAD